ncbi:MAG: hypothetical protein RLZZ211_1373 [Bacteroidota bacterium]
MVQAVTSNNGATSTLTIAGITADGSYDFRCVISDASSGLDCNDVTSQSVTLDVVPDQSITAQPTPITECIGGTSSLSVLAIDGTPSLNYQWYSNSTNSNSAGTSINGATSSTYLPPSTSSGTTYYYVVISANGSGCSSAISNATAVEVLTGPPSVNVGQDQTICSNDTASLSVTAQNAQFGTWSTTGSGVFTPNVTNSSVDYLPSLADATAGSVYLKYTATNGCGTTIDSTLVTVNQATTTDAGADVTICEGQTTALAATITPQSGAASTCQYTFNLIDGAGDGWNTNYPEDGLMDVMLNGSSVAQLGANFNNGSNYSQTVTLSNNTTYTLLFTSSINYPGEKGIQVLDASNTQVYNANPGTITNLVGQTLTTFTVTCPSTPLTIAWSPSTGLDATNTASVNANPTTTTTYTVTSTIGSCSSSDQVTVSVNPLPTATITASASTICAGSSTTLTANGGSGYAYSWSNGSTVVGTSQSISVSPSSTTNYTVTVTTASGCSTTSSATTITVNPMPTATITASASTVCAGTSTTLTASTGGSYLWSTGATTASITVSPTSNMFSYKCSNHC